MNYKVTVFFYQLVVCSNFYFAVKLIGSLVTSIYLQEGCDSIPGRGMPEKV